MPDDLIAKSLVLLVGAGASKEVNLPIGAELKKSIASALDIKFPDSYRRVGGDDVIHDAFRRIAQSVNPNRVDINPYLHAAWRIRDAMPQAISIDNFIDSHRSDEKIVLCGKLAIARCILAAERQSKLYIDRENIYNKIDFSSLENTWFNSFFQLITENRQQSDLPEQLSMVSIICFNYDRCIEHYLHGAFQNYYGMTSEEATELLNNFEIYHPYGTVGKLPWQEPQTGFAFGAEPDGGKLLALAGKLRTFTEGVDPSKSDISAVRLALNNAKNLAFLGFAFHRLNLDLLFPDVVGSNDDRSIYATASGLSNSDVQVISKELSHLAGIRYDQIRLRNDLKCFDLFREYSRTLAS